MGVLRLLTSDLAFDLCYHARLQRADGESLRVSWIWEVRPGLLFRSDPDVHDEGFMVRLADSEKHLALGHANSEEAAFSGVRGQCTGRCNGKNGAEKDFGDGHRLILPTT